MKAKQELAAKRLQEKKERDELKEKLKKKRLSRKRQLVLREEKKQKEKEMKELEREKKKEGKVGKETYGLCSNHVVLLQESRHRPRMLRLPRIPRPKMWRRHRHRHRRRSVVIFSHRLLLLRNVSERKFQKGTCFSCRTKSLTMLRQPGLRLRKKRSKTIVNGRRPLALDPSKIRHGFR